jgi:O-antigen/teichoic acid export membrane protein
MEFAQAGAVVRSQRILTNPDQAESIPKWSPVVRATLPVAICSLLALATLGILRPEYHKAWLYGLLILPGAVAAALGKTWSAALLIRRGEMAASAVAVVAAVAAVPTYFLLIATLNAIGAALAVSCIYAVYAVGAIWSLRATPRLTAGRVS